MQGVSPEKLAELQRKPAPCSEPTDAPIGSPEKIEAMAARYARGEELYHEDDATTPTPKKTHSSPIGRSAGKEPANRQSNGQRVIRKKIHGI